MLRGSPAAQARRLALIPLLGDFLSAYRLVPFLCWVPNLVVAEPVLRRPTIT